MWKPRPSVTHVALVPSAAAATTATSDDDDVLLISAAASLASFPRHLRPNLKALPPLATGTVGVEGRLVGLALSLGSGCD